jgi:replicative DNA helicase
MSDEECGKTASADVAEPRPFEIMLELAIEKLRTGSSVLDAPLCVDSVWGDGHQCLWAKGEPFLPCGPEGVGKTTLNQQLALKIIGIGEPTLLGFTVHGPRRVLYVAADRPAQVWRSFRRMVSEEDRKLLDERLVLWRGPLPFDLATEPDALLTLTRRAGAEVVFLDSLKDVAANLPKDETGVGLNRAFQICCAEGVDVSGINHQRKEQTGGRKPRYLADVYGSRWIPAGAGSVVMLWGEAGDPVVELTHLKQPDEQVGPLTVVHDHIRGVSSVVDHLDAFTIVLNSPQGATVADVAKALFDDTGRNSKEKAKSRLERLHNEGRIHREDGTRGGVNGGAPARYYSMSLLRQGGSDAG